MAREITTSWGWWHSRHEDTGCSGPFATRDEAIAEAVGGGEYAERGEGDCDVHHFWICEARQDPLRLADWIEADAMLELADESLADSDRVSYEHDEGPWFVVTSEQNADLQARIKAACDEWQAAHGLMFSCNTFSDQRNMEPITRVTGGDGGGNG